MWYMNDLIKSVSHIKNRAYNIKKKDNKETFIYDFNQSGCHEFYIRINNKFYHIDYNTNFKAAETIYKHLNSNMKPKYVFDVTILYDTVFGEIRNLGKERYLDFDYIDYYKKAIENLKGNLDDSDKNTIYWEIRRIINTENIGSPEFKAFLMQDMKEAIHYIKARNKDYTIEDYNENIDQNYFMYAKAMTIVTNKQVFNLNSMTKLSDVFELENIINSGEKIIYICDKTDDVDTVVGDIYEFTKRNGLEFYTYTYYKNVELMNYRFNQKQILSRLKG